jgi:aminopeptidase N
VESTGRWDAASQSYTLKLRQSCPATPGQAEKLPFVIPVRMGLLGADGSALPLQLEGESAAVGTERVLLLTEADQYFTFVGVGQAPTLSLFRGFSAPIIHISVQNLLEQLLILQHDSDAFNRWEAAQQLLTQAALQAYAADAEPEQAIGQELLAALQTVLRDDSLDPAFRALVLSLPTESYLAEQVAQLDAQKLHRVREAMRSQLASALHADWQAVFAAHSDTGAYVPEAKAAGRRALANLALSAICLQAVATGDTVWQGKTLQRFKDASNMTDRWGALLALASSRSALLQGALDRFYQLYQHEALVVDKWFALQAGLPEALASASGSVLAQVKQLMQHPAFSLKNPNRARSLVFAYCANAAAFHRADAAGYVFWAEQVLALDSFNPATAARLARMLERWSRLAEPQRSGALEAIQRVAAKPKLSRDVREVLDRALAQV